MIISELVLHNVGTFAGRHAINLAPPSQARPIILVGGLNGAGKTTILESIQLALYGPLWHSSTRRAGSYDSYLRSLIHRGVPASEGAAIELTFTAHQEGTEHEYWIRRSWKKTGSGVREILLVSVDGRHNQSLTSTWNEHVETFLPRGIAGLFFFDGEQIEALADLERSRQVLASALAALLGLDIVGRLSTDLAVIRRRHRGEQVPDQLRDSIAEREQLVTAHREAEQAAAETAVVRQTELEHARKVFSEATEAYRAAGGELLDQRESAEAAAATVRAAREQCEESIRQELAGITPLLLLPGMLGDLAAQVRRETEARREKVLVEALASRDQTVLEKLTDAQVAAATIAAVEEYLKSDRDQRRKSAGTEDLAGLPDHLEVEGLVSAALPAARDRLASATTRLGELKFDLDQAERVLAAIPDPEALAPLQRRREESREALRKAETADAVAAELLAAATADHEKAAAAYDHELDRAAHITLAAADDQRLLEHVDRVRATLEQLRIEATRRHLERIAQLVLEALGQLLRKQNLITDVHIDPATHVVELTGADGRELPAGDLSAGERQLLAVALLWGLARASGQPLPVVIDTPLGRLDLSHRKHLLERYFPQASHQVILLSTDTEIDEDGYDRIAPRVGRSYYLEFDPQTNATSVEDGYFWD